MFKVNNKDTRAMSMTIVDFLLLKVFLLLTLNRKIFTGLILSRKSFTP